MDACLEICLRHSTASFLHVGHGSQSWSQTSRSQFHHQYHWRSFYARKFTGNHFRTTESELGVEFLTIIKSKCSVLSRKGPLLHCCWECKTEQPPQRTVWGPFKTTTRNYDVTNHDPVPLLGIHPGKTIIQMTHASQCPFQR